MAFPVILVGARSKGPGVEVFAVKMWTAGFPTWSSQKVNPLLCGACFYGYKLRTPETGVVFLI